MENVIVIGLVLLIIALVIYFLGKRRNRKAEGVKDLVFYDSQGKAVDFDTLQDRGYKFSVQATPIKTLENRNPAPAKVSTLPKIGDLQASKLPLSTTKIDRDDTQTNNNLMTTMAVAAVLTTDSSSNSGNYDSTPSYSSGSCGSSGSSDSGSSSSDSGSSCSSSD